MTQPLLLVANPKCAFGFGEYAVRLYIDTPAGTRTFQLDRSALQVLQRFVWPKAAQQVVADTDIEERAYVGEVIDTLVSCEALVDASAAPCADPTEGLRLMAQMAQILNRMAGDLACLGEAPETLAPLVRRLRQLHADMLTLEADGDRHACSRARRQVETLELAVAEVKLNLGAGGEHIDGWISLDASQGDVRHNLLRPLPFADKSVDYVFASHVLEHLHHPNGALGLLTEVRRVLKPGGAARIVVPDIALCLSAYGCGDASFFVAREAALFGRLPRDAPLLEQVLHYAGAEPEPGLFMRSHKFGYDQATLVALIRQAGLEAQPSAFMGSGFPQLRIDDRSRTASTVVDGRHLSLFVDAVAPSERLVQPEQAL